jgi:hypothetical protein
MIERLAFRVLLMFFPLYLILDRVIDGRGWSESLHYYGQVWRHGDIL